MSTSTEILAATVLRDGAAFTARVQFVHLPLSDLPTVDLVNAALMQLGQGQTNNAGITCDSITDAPGDRVGNVLSFGTAVFLDLNCHVSNGGASVQGGQLTQWLTQAFIMMDNALSIHAPSVTGLSTIAADQGGGIAGAISTILGGGSGPSLTTTLLWVSIAVIAVVVLVGSHEVKNAL